MLNEDFELESRRIEFSEKEKREEILKLMDAIAEEEFIDSFENGTLIENLTSEEEKIKLI